jgi:hypothetical protein
LNVCNDHGSYRFQARSYLREGQFSSFMAARIAIPAASVNFKPIDQLISEATGVWKMPKDTAERGKDVVRRA